MTKDIQVLDLQDGDTIINTETGEKLKVTKVARGFAFFDFGGETQIGRLIDYTIDGKSEWMQLPRTAYVTVEA